MVALKARAAMRNGLIPLVCIGEKARSGSGIMSERVGMALREVLPQVDAVLRAVDGDGDVVFAYEPVWAIGASEPASKDHVCTVVREVRKVVDGLGRKGGVRFLYGGSAGPGTWEGLKDDLDGLFLGRFAHDLGNLIRVVEEMGG